MICRAALEKEKEKRIWIGSKSFFCKIEMIEIALFEPENEGLDHALLHCVIIDVIVFVVNGFMRV